MSPAHSFFSRTGSLCSSFPYFYFFFLSLRYYFILLLPASLFFLVHPSFFFLLLSSFFLFFLFLLLLVLLAHTLTNRDRKAEKEESMVQLKLKLVWRIGRRKRKKYKSEVLYIYRAHNPAQNKSSGYAPVTE